MKAIPSIVSWWGQEPVVWKLYPAVIDVVSMHLRSEL